jgi:HlyD family secretion protein
LEYRQAEANLAALSSPAAIASAEQALQEAKLAFVSATDDLQYLLGPDMLIAEENLSEAQSELQLAKAAAEKDSSEENKQKLAAAETALTKAEAALAQAKRDYEGYLLQTFIYPVRNDHGVTVSRTLFAPTDTEIATARAAYELGKANLHDAQNYLDVLKGNTTSDAVPASSVTSITEAKIAFDKAKVDLDAAELFAPISGTVTSINLTAGENPGTSAVVTISNLDQPYTVDAYLDESDWDKAKIGNAATVTFDLLPDNNYSGTITQVYPKLDDSSGISMVHILVTLDVDASLDLPPGASASVDVTGGEALGAILVPISALRETDSGKYIVYIMENDKPVEREVEIGLQDILYAEVKSGLQVGDVVLTDPTINE